jgi:hypothetical protein
MQQKHNQGRGHGRRVLAIAVILGAWILTSSQEPVPESQEYFVKAAFVCQMIKFITWPKGKPVDANNVVTISIVGPNRFGKAFDPAKTQLLKDKTLVVKEFKLLKPPALEDPNQQIAWAFYIRALQTSHIVYVTGAPAEDVRPLFTALQTPSVLTFGESDGFVDKGGMVNFLPQQEKIRFEVNLTATHAAHIQISSKVLRLASRVLGKEDSPPG